MAGRRTAKALLSIDMEKFPEIECCMRKAKYKLMLSFCKRKRKEHIPILSMYALKTSGRIKGD